MPPDFESQITLEQVEDGTFVATCAALPGFVARGDTEGAAIRKIKKALKVRFRAEGRDYLRITQRGGVNDAFRWSRYRVPLALRFPLSRNVKLGLAAFGAGAVLGAAVLVSRQRRR